MDSTANTSWSMDFYEVRPPSSTSVPGTYRRYIEYIEDGEGITMTYPQVYRLCRHHGAGSRKTVRVLQMIWRKREAARRVPITLRRDLPPDRVIGTRPVGVKRCGIGQLQRDGHNPTRGRDVQLPCKRKACPRCQPDLVETTFLNMTRTTADLDLRRLVVSAPEWEAVHRSLDRGGYSYYRVPLPDGQFAVYTNAPRGESVPEEHRRDVIGTDLVGAPCDGRRITSSRDWQNARGDVRNSAWIAEGNSPLPPEERHEIYLDHDLDPAEEQQPFNPDREPAVLIRLPLRGTPEWDRLAAALRLRPLGNPTNEGWPATE